MKIDFRRLTGSALACASIFLGPVFLDTSLSSPASIMGSAAHAAEGIRVPTDVCAWDDIDWKDMNSAEQQAWSALGWTKKLWDSDSKQPPSSSDKNWADLDPNQRAAAQSLGYTESSWEAACKA
jgi:hypothetical protein